MKKYIYWGIILFFISLVIGYLFGNEMFLGLNSNNVNRNNINNNINKVDDTTNTVLQTIAREIKILPNTKLGLKKYHKSCNHISFEFVELPEEFVNKTEEDIKKIYPHWEVEEFYENKVILYKEVEGICDEHFFITLGNEFIEIYKYIDENNNKMLYKTTDLSKNYLTTEDIEKLEKGIILYGKDRLSSVIEDFE